MNRLSLRLLDRGAPTLLYALSGGLVLLSGYFLSRYLSIKRCTGHYFGYTSWLSNWDGQWYQYIVDRGYHYADDGGYGPQAFFPLYPLLGRLLGAISPLHGQLPLVSISWLSAFAFLFVWMRYATERIAMPLQRAALWGLALILFWPVSYFLRAAYTESLYLLLLTLFFYGCAKRWRPAYLVIITGLLTATRPTGVLASIVLAIHLFRRYPNASLSKRIAVSLALAAISAWGLYAYAAFLYVEFGDPFLFIGKQAAWNYRMPADIFLVRWREMLSFRPVWEFIVDGSLLRPDSYSWSLQNRVMWLLAGLLTATGCIKRWLSIEETVFCVMTLLLIYFTNGPKNMESVGRYVSTLVPLYLVMTRLLMALPITPRIALIGASAVLLAFQSAQFSLWGCVF